MVALVQKEIIIIIIIIPEILFNTEYIAFSVFPFILTIVFLHHDSANPKPAWFCSRCSVVSVSSDVKLHFVQFESNSVQCLAAGDQKINDHGSTGFHG